MGVLFQDVVWPRVCPVLGLKLDYSFKGDGRARRNSPSIDRIRPELGYVPGNVIVVSQLANQIKSCATVDQLKRVASFFEQFLQ